MVARSWLFILIFRGQLITYLRSVMIPRDFKVAPSECFLHPNAEVFTEYTVLRGWLSQWLKYVHWYAKVAMSSDLSLESFFDDPVVESNWRLTGTDALISKGPVRLSLEALLHGC